MPIPALIAGTADLIGGLISSQGQRSANQSNERIARENRAFQERMSSTAYQRSTKDLEAAGLNRILALGSPSSSPSGSTATMQNPKEGIAKGVSKSAHSAMALKMQSEQLHLMASQAAMLDNSAAAQHADAVLKHRQMELIDTSEEEILARVNNINQQTNVNSATATIQGNKAALYDQIGPLVQGARDMFPKSMQPIIDAFLKSWKARNTGRK